MGATSERRWTRWVPQMATLLAGLGCLAAFPLGQADWFVATDSTVSMVSGRAITNGLSSTLPTAALAALGLMLVFGRAGRRFLGFVVAGLGMAAVMAGLVAKAPDAGVESLGAAGRTASATPAHTLFLVAMGVVAAAGLLVAGVPGAEPRPRAGRPESDWAILDRGADPTAD